MFLSQRSSQGPPTQSFFSSPFSASAANSHQASAPLPASQGLSHSSYFPSPFSVAAPAASGNAFTSAFSQSWSSQGLLSGGGGGGTASQFSQPSSQTARCPFCQSSDLSVPEEADDDVICRRCGSVAVQGSLRLTVVDAAHFDDGDGKAPTSKRRNAPVAKSSYNPSKEPKLDAALAANRLKAKAAERKPHQPLSTKTVAEREQRAQQAIGQAVAAALTKLEAIGLSNEPERARPLVERYQAALVTTRERNFGEYMQLRARKVYFVATAAVLALDVCNAITFADALQWARCGVLPFGLGVKEPKGDGAFTGDDGGEGDDRAMDELCATWHAWALAGASGAAAKPASRPVAKPDLDVPAVIMRVALRVARMLRVDAVALWQAAWLLLVRFDVLATCVKDRDLAGVCLGVVAALSMLPGWHAKTAACTDADLDAGLCAVGRRVEARSVDELAADEAKAQRYLAFIAAAQPREAAVALPGIAAATSTAAPLWDATRCAGDCLGALASALASPTWPAEARARVHVGGVQAVRNVRALRHWRGEADELIRVAAALTHARAVRAKMAALGAGLPSVDALAACEYDDAFKSVSLRLCALGCKGVCACI